MSNSLAPFERGEQRDLLFVSDVSPYRGPDGGQTPAGAHQSLGSAALAFRQIAALTGLAFRQPATVEGLTVPSIEQARVLVLFTIGETPWSVALRQAVVERMQAGELGVVAVHSATDSAYGWEEFGDIVGARFSGHPVTGDLSITVVDRGHPATAHLPSPWRFKEELYVFRDLRPGARVLLGVDIGPGTAGLSNSGDRLLPLCWCLERGLARSFYTVLGHFVAAYEDGAYLQHLRGAVDWALGGGPR